MSKLKPNSYFKTSILLFIIYAVLMTTNLQAKPTFKWSLKKLNFEQMQGTRSVHKVTVKASIDIHSAWVDITPKLKKWITVSPTVIRNIEKNKLITLTIFTIVPHNALICSRSGVIKLRNITPGKPQNTFAKPLPVKIKVVENNNDGLPPHPGEEGKLTLTGIDSDNDGVRDDVQIAIANRYPDNVEARFASREFAKAMQNSLIAYQLKDINLIHTSLEQTLTSVTRMHALSEFASADIALIEMQMQNTPKRLDAYLSVSEYMTGQSYVSQYDPNEKIEDVK